MTRTGASITAQPQSSLFQDKEALRRFPLIAAVVAALPVRTCLIDGEAIACDERGVAVFELIRYRRQDYAVTLSAFDLLEIDGEDMRNAPIEQRKQVLARLLTRSYNGIALNAHYGGDGAVIFKRACQLGHEGIVSKRLGSPYCSGRSDHWIKIKNPSAPAAKREAAEFSRR